MAFTAERLLRGPEIAGSLHERPADGLAVDYTPVGSRTDGPREMGSELETEGVGLGHPGRVGLTECTHGSCLIESVDLDGLLDRIGDARVVLLGEASHGTSEFYLIRARVTRDLIVHQGFCAVAVEAN